MYNNVEELKVFLLDQAYDIEIDDEELAEVFEKAKLVYDERDIIRRSGSGGFPLEFRRLNGELPETLVKAYYFGYEIDTPEDRVRNLFNSYLVTGETETSKAIRRTLDILNIKINGIN